MLIIAINRKYVDVQSTAQQNSKQQQVKCCILWHNMVQLIVQVEAKY